MHEHLHILLRTNAVETARCDKQKSKQKRKIEP